MARDAYHHGDLPAVLLQKTDELLEERGVDGFSLREVARRADVAAAAPSHHFGNATGLLTAVAVESFRKMIAKFDAISQKGLSPEETLVGICEAYVSHHSEHPGSASIMFRWEILESDNAALSEVSSLALDALRSAVRQNLENAEKETNVEALTKVIWAAMHGLVSLRLTEGQETSNLVRLAAVSAIHGQKISLSRPEP